MIALGRRRNPAWSNLFRNLDDAFPLRLAAALKWRPKKQAPH